MTYDFFAANSDKINLLNFIFKETDLKVFDLASPYGQEISEYKSTDEIMLKYGFESEISYPVKFQLWTPRFGGKILFRKVVLNPKHCDGHTFCYSSDGWGLIQLYFEGQKDNLLLHSHIGHFNERGALKWEDSNHFNGRVEQWNWEEIERTSRQLKNHIHSKMSVQKIGGYGILPGACELINEGLKLWVGK